MSKITPEDQLDRTLAKIFADATVSETETDEIADSPALWRAIKREIRSGAKDSHKIWPPVKLWLWAAVPTFAVVVVVGFVVGSGMLTPTKNIETASADRDVPVNSGAMTPPEPITISPPSERNEQRASDQFALRTVVPKTQGRNTRPIAAPVAVAERRPKKAAEPIKSDFIALSLAPRPEAGQIVKLRVPSTLMVSLGLVESVSKPSAMVDAEVLMGDDGLTHSIRSIR